MGTPFLSEIKIMSFNFAPKSWAVCNGQLLPINQNQALFALLGTTYGGDGQVNFALPNLRGRAPMHVGGGHTLGESAGQESHTVSVSEMPQHIHFLQATSNQATAFNPNPAGTLGYAKAPSATYAPASSLVGMAPGTVGSTGGSQAHQNMQPFLVLNFCIALQGVFPSQN